MQISDDVRHALFTIYSATWRTKLVTLLVFTIWLTNEYLGLQNKLSFSIYFSYSTAVKAIIKFIQIRSTNHFKKSNTNQLTGWNLMYPKTATLQISECGYMHEQSWQVHGSQKQTYAVVSGCVLHLSCRVTSRVADPMWLQW